MQTNQVKTLIFLFHDLPACTKKADILPLTSTLIAHLGSQFNYVFALFIPMPCFKSINFCKIGLKLSYFCTKKLQNLRALGAKPPDPLAKAPRPPAYKPPIAEPTLT